MAQHTTSGRVYPVVIFDSASIRGQFLPETPMPILYNELPDDLYMITRPVPEAGAQPFDSLTVDRSAQPHFLLQRHLDEYDVRAILDRAAFQAVPDSIWDAIPPRSLIRHRRHRAVASLRASAGLRLL